MPALHASWIETCQRFFMRLLSITILISIPAQAQSLKMEDLIDYSTLNHSITIESIRADNHDKSGENQYFFVVNVHALAVRSEDRRKSFAERAKVTKEMGRFGAATIKSLSFWRPEEERQPTLSINGDTIRKLISDAMREFQIPEQQVAVMTEIQMFEENKQFIFIGEDTLVGEVSYYIIPEVLPHRPILDNKKLEISDTLGAFVNLRLKFQAIEASASR
ncbi:MAG: hypothetical protein ACOH5I_01560 [Oligoflexus sp.]